MALRLSDHFTYKRLLRFVFPSIVMMIFTSIYGVVDGFFVSNFVGAQAFSAVNFIMPFLMMPGTIGFMFGTGGSALIAKTLGEKDSEKANRYFSLLVYSGFALGIVLAAVCIVFLRPIAIFLGADGGMLEYSVRYGRIILIALPAFILQYMFQSFFVTAEKPKLGLAVTLASGFTNMVMDYLLIGVLRMDVEGAALATAASQIVGGVLPLFYFFRKNNSLLRLGRTRFEIRPLLISCLNGLSELLSNLSMSLVNMLYNAQLLKFAGENGVAAYGTIMYVNFIFVSIYVGFAAGSAPIVSYHYGAGNRAELRNLFKKSLVFNGVSSVILTVAAELLAPLLATIFVGYDAALYDLTLRGFMIYSLAFLLMGFNIYASSFFTALGDGVVSAVISFMRTLIFQIIAVLILPIFWEIDGVWCSIVAAELLAIAVSAFFFVKMRKKYGYA
ncbi:MAG: MATE family efflux transporter [Clostridia bacterium]|nr:MATE family efflux transporter [Clostridia bacterium]